MLCFELPSKIHVVFIFCKQRGLWNIDIYFEGEGFTSPVSVWQTGCPNTTASPVLALHGVGKTPPSSSCFDPGEDVAVFKGLRSWFPDKINHLDTDKQAECILSHKTHTESQILEELEAYILNS